MDDSISSLNSTFSIEEEKSYLGNYGTPLNFKKLSERPATVANIKYNSNSHISFKAASSIRLNHQLYHECNVQNGSGFISPQPMQRKLEKTKFNNQSPMFISPIQYKNVQRRNQPVNDSFLSSCRTTSPIQQTKRTVRIKLPESVEKPKNPNLKLLAQSERKPAQKHTTPLQPKHQPIDILWSLNRKKEQARREEEEKRIKKTTNIDLSPPESPSTFVEKMKQYAAENFGYRRLSKEVITNKENVVKVSEDDWIHKRFLEVRAQQEAEEAARAARLRPRNVSPPEKIGPAFYKDLELNLREWAASCKPDTKKTTKPRPQPPTTPTVYMSTPINTSRAPRQFTKPTSSIKKWR